MLPGKKYTPDDYARMAWRRRWYIAIPAIVIASGTMVVAKFLPDRYRASTTILIVPQQVPENFVHPAVEEDLTQRINTISQQILSRTKLEQIVQEFNLYEGARKRLIMEDVIENMRKDINTNIPRQRGRRDEVRSFSVSYTAEEPRTAMRVTERLASLFVNQNLQDREARADQTTEFLKGQLDAARRELEAQEKKVADFRRLNAGRLPDQVQSNLQLLQGLQNRQQAITESNNRDRDRMATLEKQLAELPPVSSTSSAMAAPTRRSGNSGNNDQIVASAAQQLETARNELRALQLRLKPDHPDIGRAKRAVADLEAKAEAEALQQPLSAVTPAPVSNPAADKATLARAEQIRTEMIEVRQRIESQRREHATVEQQIADYTSRVQAGPGLQAELTQKTRDYETQQQSYVTLLKKSQESQMALTLEQRQIGEQFKTLEGARLPERPISPDRVRINLFGILGGLALGLGLVAFLEYRDTSFKSDDDVMTTLALPVLAVIPVMTNAAERRLARRRKLLLAAAASVTCMLLAAAVMIVWKNTQLLNRLLG